MTLAVQCGACGKRIAWLEAGLPEENPKDAASPPPLPSGAARRGARWPRSMRCAAVEIAAQQPEPAPDDVAERGQRGYSRGRRGGRCRGRGENTIARWLRPTRRAGAAGWFMRSCRRRSRRISNTARCSISTCSRSPGLHVVLDWMCKYRGRRRRGLGARLVCRRRSPLIENKRKEKIVHLFSFDQHHRHFPKALRDVAVRALCDHHGPPI